jgi:predicted nucleic acid-binding protein
VGLILDSSALVAVERQGKNARQVLADISDKVGETDVAISLVTLIELAHGAARADTPERKAKREEIARPVLDRRRWPVSTMSPRPGRIRKDSGGRQRTNRTTQPIEDETLMAKSHAPSTS